MESKSIQNKTKKKNKLKPIFYLLENDILTRMSSNTSSSNKNNKNSKLKTKTKKRRLKVHPELIIMEPEKLNPENPKQRFNEEFIGLLDELSNIMLKQGEIFKARAYQKAQETVMTFEGDIIRVDQLKGLPGIGSTIMEKLEEYVKTGTLKILEREKNNPVNILGEVYGIGPKKAQELVNSGIITLEQLESNKNLLNDIQKVGLKYHQNILKRIPRSEIEDYYLLFSNAFNQVKNMGKNSHFEIVGSYRRGAATSGDIDIIITSENPAVYVNFIDILIKENIIIEVLSRGASKCLVIAKLPDHEFARRIDFLYTPPNEYAFALLYFTGSKIFNTVMRQRALNMGYTFNEHGIYKLENKKKGSLLENTFPDEKSIFDFLNLVYKEPVERIDGRSVVKLNNLLEGEKEKGEKEKGEKEKGEKGKGEKEKEKGEKEKEKGKSKNKTIKHKIILKEVKESEEKEEITNNLIKAFKKMGITILEQLTEKQLTDIIHYANKMYYMKTSILTDNEFDIIKEFLEKKYPHNLAILEIGAPVERNKVKLPYEMPSMDKIKPDTNALENWIKKYPGPYLLSCKLDGVSGMYTTEGKEAKLYTRGTGKVGQDISHLIPYLNLPKTKDITIRGEFMILKDDFEKYLKNKYANPRNLVSGIINHKSIDENIKYVHFIVYEVINPELKPSDQMAFLKTLNMDIVLHEERPILTNEILSELLVKWRKEYKYEIDGLIVTEDKIYNRKSGNPEHSFAFKMVLSDQIAEAKVVDVIWTPSKDGYLKPRVRIEPIHLGGVTIEYATGFNAAFILKNKIGIGSLIEIIRSGDVIPHIKGVTMPAEEAKMPSVPYKWNDSHIDVLLENIEDDVTVKETNITGFFKGIHVDGLSSGNIHRIVEAGYDSINKIIKMKEDDFLKVDGFKQKLANKIYNGIQEQLKKASLIELMANSHIFGRGISEKKIEIILNELPNILSSADSHSNKIIQVSKVKGMAQKSAENFVDKINDFKIFLHEIGHDDKLLSTVNLNTNAIDSSNPLYQKNIVLTGLRDKDLMEKLKKNGANISSSVSKNTFLVIAKSKEEDTGKTADANKLGIPIFTVEEFVKKYF